MIPFQNFNPATTRYQPENAYSLGAAANLAYENESKITTTANSWGFNQVKFISKRETQLFIAGNDQYIIVAFRGTEPQKLADWMTDADIEKCPGPFSSRVHSGFDRALSYVWDELVATLKEFQNQGQSLWMTGHSLGAALATLATAYLRDAGRRPKDPKDKPVHGLYTFGSPRAGNRDFEHAFNLDAAARTFRFVNNNDIVTRVPPREFDYSHVGKFLYFNADGKTLEADPHWWYQFLEGIKGAFENLWHLEPDNIRDHSMDNYLTLLERHIKDNPF